MLASITVEPVDLAIILFFGFTFFDSFNRVQRWQVCELIDLNPLDSNELTDRLEHSRP